MDQLPSFGKNIADIIFPTFKAFLPLLKANAQTITSIKKQTFTYGPTARHTLDVYTPSDPATPKNGRRPLLMFEYGGGFVQGATSLPMMENLMHANVGAFFALKAGYTVVIADYRLLSHGAKFPSGGEDLALAVEWIVANQPGPGKEPIDLFMMGASAGGVHTATFLLQPAFAATRAKVLSGEGTRLRGAVLLSVPVGFDAQYISERNLEAGAAYFGKEEVAANSVIGQLKSAREKQGVLDFVKAGTRVLVLHNELDPELDILFAREEFLREWAAMTDIQSQSALAVDWLEGHNHISAPCSLLAGGEREDAWGHQVISFCDAASKHPLRS